MSNLSLFLIAAGLASDAFSVAVAKGTFIKKNAFTIALKVGFMFGLFQFLMPLLGLALGTKFMKVFSKISNLAASVMLFIIGGNMIFDALKNNFEEDDKTSLLSLIIPSLATSIDALALGFTLSCFDTKIFFTASVIGITAFLFSFFGVYIGKKFSSVSQRHGAAFGGIILLILAFKFLISFIF